MKVGVSIIVLMEEIGVYIVIVGVLLIITVGIVVKTKVVF